MWMPMAITELGLEFPVFLVFYLFAQTKKEQKKRKNWYVFWKWKNQLEKKSIKSHWIAGR